MPRTRGSQNFTNDVERILSRKERSRTQSKKRRRDRETAQYKRARVELQGYADLWRSPLRTMGESGDVIDSKFDLAKIDAEYIANARSIKARVHAAVKELRANPKQKSFLLDLHLPYQTTVQARKDETQKTIQTALNLLDDQAAWHRNHGNLKVVDHIGGFKALLSATVDTPIRYLSLEEVLKLPKSPQYGVPQVGYFTKRQYEWYIRDPQRIRNDLPILYSDDTRRRKTVEIAKDFIRTGALVDVQIYGTDGKLDVKTIRCEELVEYLDQARADRTPANCLSLEPHAPEPFPLDSLPYMSGLKHREALDGESKIVSSIIPDREASRRKRKAPVDFEADRVGALGKPSRIREDDLSACTHFALLASAGAITGLHMDRVYLFTSVCNRDGLKLWSMSAPLTREQLVYFGEHGKLPEDVKTFTVQLGPGDVLVMPPSTVHFPTTVENCYMEGAMHMMFSDFLSIAKTALAELRYPNITNEPSAQQLVRKLRHFHKKCKKNPDDLTFGRPSSQADLKEFEQVIEVFQYSSDELVHLLILDRNLTSSKH